MPERRWVMTWEVHVERLSSVFALHASGAGSTAATAGGSPEPPLSISAYSYSTHSIIQQNSAVLRSSQAHLGSQGLNLVLGLMRRRV